MSSRLEGNVCVITTTGGSMGRASGLAYGREGASVVGCDLGVEAAQDTVERVHRTGGEMVSMHRSRRDGAVVCAMFSGGVAAQTASVAWPVTREIETGMPAMVIGRALAVRGVWLRPPLLGLFIAAGALIGAGGGPIFRGAVGTVMSIAPPDRIEESLAGMLLAAFVGRSLPVVGPA